MAEAELSNTHFLCNEAVLLVFVCGQVRGVCVTCNVLPTPKPGQLATLELAVIATLEYYGSTSTVSQTNTLTFRFYFLKYIVIPDFKPYIYANLFKELRGLQLFW